MAWAAQISMEKYDDPDTAINVYIRTEATSEHEAKASAQFLYETIGGKKVRFLRVPPGTTSQTDFETKVTRYRGFCRFAFRDEPGEEFVPSPAPQDQTISLGDFAGWT